MFQTGGKVKVKNNLGEELRRLGYEKRTCKSMQETYAETEQEILRLWLHEETEQKYATIDLCVEIPLQCLELAKT